MFFENNMARYIFIILILCAGLVSACSDGDETTETATADTISTLHLHVAPRPSSEGVVRNSETRTAEYDENRMEYLRVLIFSASGLVVDNRLHAPHAEGTWHTRIGLKPGNYELYLVANEHGPTMRQELEKIHSRDELLSAPCMERIHRDNGMILSESGLSKCFLMTGSAQVTIPDHASEHAVTVPLKRLMSKVEVEFTSLLPQGQFRSFSLGNFPEYFSAWDFLYYPVSHNDGDTPRAWSEPQVVHGKTYTKYIPPFCQSDPSNVNSDKINWTLDWEVNGIRYSENLPFRESDDRPNIWDVRSNYHYKYRIRLVNEPQNPLVVECRVIPWKKEPQKNYFANGECNLEIEKIRMEGQCALRLTLQHVEGSRDFDFANYHVSISEDKGYYYDVFANSSSDKARGEWDGWDRCYKYSFMNDGTGKAVLRVKASTTYVPNTDEKYGDCVFDGYKIDLERLNGTCL